MFAKRLLSAWSKLKFFPKPCQSRLPTSSTPPSVTRHLVHTLGALSLVTLAHGLALGPYLALISILACLTRVPDFLSPVNLLPPSASISLSGDNLPSLSPRALRMTSCTRAHHALLYA